MKQPRPPAGPYSIVHLDLELGLAERSAVIARESRHEEIWVVARRRGVPQAVVETTRTAADAALRDVVESAGAAPLDHVPDAALPSATVVVCSIVSRHADLRRCLDQLDALVYPGLEVLLVDNRPELPSDDPLPGLLAGHPRVRVVRCPTPGLSAARNSGIAAASGEIIAFTDDDTLVDATWMQAIGRRFVVEPALDAVTGLILPAELESPAQVYFERYYGGFAGVRSYRRLTAQGHRRLPARARAEVCDEAGGHVRHMPVYGVGAMGAGANMAFRRSTLARLHGFDLDLGLGTPAKGGEDLAMLMRVLWAGGAIGYEPAAAIAHRHRVAYDELATQMRYYGLGYSATLTSLVRHDPRHVLGLVLLGVPAAADFVAASWRRVRGRAGTPGSDAHGSVPRYPRELFTLELSGLPRGPVAYFRSVAEHRRRSRT